MKRFEVLDPLTGRIVVLFALAKKAKEGELDEYVSALLDRKDTHTSELMFLNAFETLQSGRFTANDPTLLPLASQLTKEHMRQYWKEAKRRQRAAKLIPQGY